jgi:hypothetical protein
MNVLNREDSKIFKYLCPDCGNPVFIFRNPYKNKDHDNNIYSLLVDGFGKVVNCKRVIHDCNMGLDAGWFYSLGLQ